MYIIICPFTKKCWAYTSRKGATQAAIKKNKADSRHPAYELYKIPDDRSGKGKIIGVLFRKFGHDFDPEDCWG